MKNKKLSNLRWIFRTGGKSWKWVALQTAVRVLQAATALTYASTLKIVIDTAVSGRKTEFMELFILFVGVILLSLVLLVASRYLAEKATTEMEKTFRTHVFSQLLSRDYETVDATHTGDWQTRMDSDVGVIVSGVVRIVPDLTGNILRVAAVLLILLETVPLIVYLVIPGTMAVALFSLVFREKMKRFHRIVQEANSDLRGAVQERLVSLDVIHAFTQEENTIRQINGKLKTVAQSRMKRNVFLNLCLSSISFGLFSAQAIGIGLCCWNIMEGNMTYGTMSAVLYLINQLEGPVVNMSSYISQAYSMLASAERLIEIEALPPDLTEAQVPFRQARSFYDRELQSLGLENASFAYRDGKNETIIRNLNLEVRKGEFVCFTGESGCGKSTTMKLLLNLYPLSGGSAYLTSADGSRQELHGGWRSLFAYVPQGNHLISGTIRETLAFGDQSRMAEDSLMWDALKISCAEEFVRELPDGLDTLLGERGSGLSEGQMQRIAIARAVFSQRPILLLDECTSALDGQTEYTLLDNLKSMTDRTVLTITHRPAVLEYCDRQIQFGSGDIPQ